MKRFVVAIARGMVGGGGVVDRKGRAVPSRKASLLEAKSSDPILLELE